MAKFYENFTFMFLFLVFLVFFHMLIGTKATEYLLIIILMGMVLTNIDTVKNLIGGEEK